MPMSKYYNQAILLELNLLVYTKFLKKQLAQVLPHNILININELLRKLAFKCFLYNAVKIQVHNLVYVQRMSTEHWPNSTVEWFH